MEKKALPPRIRIYKAAFDRSHIGGWNCKIEKPPFQEYTLDPKYWSNYHEFMPVEEHEAALETATRQARAETWKEAASMLSVFSKDQERKWNDAVGMIEFYQRQMRKKAEKETP